MADYRAIAATCESVIALLQHQYNADLFNNDLEFKVYTAQDFEQPMGAGVSLFLYRVLPNGTRRAPPSQGRGQGLGRGHSRLPLDLHFLLTVWGKEASLRHSLVGWLMRVMEDFPSLPASHLNSIWPGVFDASESVELIHNELTNEDLSSIWDTFIRQSYQLSIPYLARVIEIDSLREPTETGVVREQQQGIRPL